MDAQEYCPADIHIIERNIHTLPDFVAPHNQITPFSQTKPFFNRSAEIGEGEKIWFLVIHLGQ